ncbi:hypothetical protein [Staphylococcus succinus]|uniref:hypothetical protein n=1 Tax=Staphylococcus succinus TaxID=61015 RepID=UPI000D1D8C62|nr:hypothetical protein [Staphylococcus succinus]PTI38869.1 hypothetical protein BU062_12515 [Staphylococcus succinus]PTI48461.1 hypothetical protein BU060_03255 [Staphylococcus succinus]
MRKVNKAAVIKGKIPFGNGKVYPTDRYYIVLDEEEEHYYLINCSSIKGKENKLIMPSNTEIIDCIPPLKVKSMAKMDEVYKVNKKCASIFKTLPCNLKNNSFNKLKKEFETYLSLKHVSNPTIITYDYDDLSKCN